MNPCMPLWEHIADGEPRVFTDPATGEERIYVYGSHDTTQTFFCSLEYTLWSAPVEDLSNWTNHGVIYRAEKSNEEVKFAYAFAPDCVQGTDGRFYLYAFPIGLIKDTRNVLVSDRPIGPFEPIGRIDILGDPAVLVDTNGDVYCYNGGPGMDTPTVSELGSDMLTVKATKRMEMEDGTAICNFFEASSIRKIGNWYIYIYSSGRKENPEFFTQTAQGLTNGYAVLEYCYSKNPMGPWKYGGILMNNGGESLGNSEDYYYGTRRSYYNGTIHGSIIEIRDQWYVFYHRNTNNHDFSRQTCMDPIEVIINNTSVFISEGEMTSQGWEREGLAVNRKYSAGIACYLTNGAYITYGDNPEVTPIVNIKNGTIAGVKYINFGKEKSYRISISIKVKKTGVLVVTLDNPTGQKIAEVSLLKEDGQSYKQYEVSVGKIQGIHSVFFLFYQVGEDEVCEWNSFEFIEEGMHNGEN